MSETLIYNTDIRANYNINRGNEMIIDIGSGPHPKPDANIRMDLHPWNGVNVLHNLLETPYPFESNLFDKAYMGDVIEHIYVFDIDRVMTEVNRILKPGGVLEITVPDFRWIFERIVYGDWKEKANVEWLNRHDDPWKNALGYLFGGFYDINQYKMEGMGHVNAFDEKSMFELLEKNGFANYERVPDLRNPEPARNAVLKVVCKKV